MIQKIIDFHIHSKYSRACSKLLELPNIAKACAEKGIDIVSTGDFTHPLWLKHIEESLEEEGNGLLKLKNSASKTRFILGTEVSCIYKDKEKVRRLHILIFAPSLSSVKKLNDRFESLDINLRSDGRPIMGLSAKEILKICLSVDSRMIVVPAHAWTPWFSVFGSKSGYDNLEDCFEELTPKIFSIETGLSSDPVMNRQVSKLDKITLISNSDAHSLEKLGREANVLVFKNDSEVGYDRIWEIIKKGDSAEFLYTIEFYPEEGMYHLDGHKDCGVSLLPKESKKEALLCPKCKKKLILGVLHRVEELADRKEGVLKGFVPSRYIIPLREIIANSFGVGAGSKKVEMEYRTMIEKLGTEFRILLDVELDKIKNIVSDENIALGIANMRSGMVKIDPGYDGVYGTINVFPKEKIRSLRQSHLI